MTASSPLLQVRISVDYPGKSGVLRNISLDVDPGEILGLVGESGSGKSTIALAVLGLLPLKGGSVRGQISFRGQDLLSKRDRELRALRGRDVSIVLQSPLTSLNPVLRIGTQLKEAWHSHANGSAAVCLEAIRAALTSVRLPNDKDFLKRKPSQLSLGQAQRVIIAMAILHRPSLLIADEPTSALDTITQAEILRLLARLNRELNMAILYISHDLLSLASLCHRVAILYEGQIVESGSPQQILDSPRHEYTQRLVDALPKRPVRNGSSVEIVEGASSQDALAKPFLDPVSAEKR
ncbi:MAG TPA: ABC transporter ATP-binding protein [Candidatus Saccharimonadales bacterium]|nr:ABC transporter ATP-binding protein [Candidatus Saccharimonadales bacterium]